MGEICERGGEGSETIVVEVEEVGERGEFAEGVGERGELVVAEVESAEVFELGDLGREVGEVVVGEDESLQVGASPDGVRDVAEMLFPKVEFRGRVGHGGIVTLRGNKAEASEGATRRRRGHDAFEAPFEAQGKQARESSPTMQKQILRRA